MFCRIRNKSYLWRINNKISMMNTCKTYSVLTSFTGNFLVKGDNMLASKQSSKQASIRL